jgi:hypothetical protein
MRKPTHRRDAENAECFIALVEVFLCVLCVSAVNTVYRDEHYPTVMEFPL